MNLKETGLNYCRKGNKQDRATNMDLIALDMIFSKCSSMFPDVCMFIYDDRGKVVGKNQPIN